MRTDRTFTVFFALLAIAPIAASARTIGVPGDQPSIQAGINAASVGDTVLVQPGRYLETIDFKGKDIVVGSLFLATQDTSYISQTIIDGNKNGTVVTFKNGETEKAELCGVTVTGGNTDSGGGGIYCWNSSSFLHNLSVENNFSVGSGGGILLQNSSSVLESIILKYNHATSTGGGVCFKESKGSIIKQSFIFNNEAAYGTGISCLDSGNIKIINCALYSESGPIGNRPISIINSKCDIINCTIVDIYNYIEWVVECEYVSKLNIINTIIWTTKSKWQIYSYNEKNNPGNIINVAYSNIINKDGIFLSKQDSLYWLEGNISLDPLFNDIKNNDYSLQKGSPCIDAGTSFFSTNGNVILNLSENQFKGLHPDMGAFESDYFPTRINDVSPAEFEISNYPNPFNPSTTIEFSLPERSRVNLSVFTITGQKVFDLFSGALPSGKHSIRWNGTDSSGKNLSSGVYLVRLDDGRHMIVRRILLMK